MTSLFIYQKDFLPIGLPGETFHLMRAAGEADVEIQAVDALPELINNFGAIAAVSWLRDQEITNLELSDGEFGQFRMRVTDDVRLYLKNPAPTQKWRSSRANFYIPQFPVQSGEDFLKEYFFTASEFFTFEDETPRFDLYAILAAATSRVAFSGFRFRYKKLPAEVKGKVTLWVNGWPSGKV